MKLLDHTKTQEVLKKYTFKTPKEYVVNGVSSAAITKVVGFAEKLGFPVVAKVISKDIPLKSEAGGVITSLTSSEEVEKACVSLLKTVKRKKAKARLQGLHIQKMSQGTDIKVSLQQDAQFGPVVILGDSIGFAPFDKNRAEAMLVESGLPETLKIQEQLKDILTKLAKFGSENPSLTLELHPIVVTSSSAEVVDAKLQTN